MKIPSWLSLRRWGGGGGGGGWINKQLEVCPEVGQSDWMQLGLQVAVVHVGTERQ